MVSADCPKVSALDAGDPSSPIRYGPIHTRAKQAVAARLALAAMRVAYGDATALEHGPRLSSVKQARERRRRFLRHTSSGHVSLC